MKSLVSAVRQLLTAAVVAVVFFLPAAPLQAQVAGPNCARTSVPMTPLIDLGKRTYEGYTGGLYPGGSNAPPTAHLRLGLQRAKSVRPRSAAGKPSSKGRIVLLSIGMSNAVMEWNGFLHSLPANMNARVTVVNGAHGGQDAVLISNAQSPYWSYVDGQLQTAGVSPGQVQVVWLKEAIINEHRPFPADAQGLESDLRTIVHILARRFPNLQIIYLASRTYAGYAVTPLNPEPYAYESGFAVKWLVESQIRHEKGMNANSSVKGHIPWLAWGPYLWTNGTAGRSDGFTWQCPEDVQADGTHPSRSGDLKVGALLVRFFQTDRTAKSWFVAR